MNGQGNTAEYDFLWKLLANPADNNHSYIFSLQSLVSDFPQSGALRALLMPNGDKRHVKHAAAYFNPGLLHKLATAPDSLAKVSNEQIIFNEAGTGVLTDVNYAIPQAEPFVPPVPDAEAAYVQVLNDDDAEPVEKAADFTDDHLPPPVPTFEPEAIVDSTRENIPAYIDEGEPADAVDSLEVPSITPEPEPVAEATPMAFHQETELQPVIEQPLSAPEPEPAASFHEEQKNNLAREYEAYMAKTDITPTEPVSSYEEVRYFHQPIDDEVYDEIVSIEDIGLEQLAILNKSAQEATADENYFVFEPAISGDSNQQNAPEPEKYAETTEQQAAAATYQQAPPPDVAYPDPYFKDDVSKYNDEKMPYTFMWWLDKTRKEHAYIYQPYTHHSAKQSTQPAAENKPQKPVVDELQQQYYQSIVANTSLTDYDKTAPLLTNAQSNRKEDKIIERFIQEEPHIKHPAEIKLDNENKAKRSSEDKEELVTETLARIYTEQMLYHKAIITYKKLMLKYPEKSLYFAGQIEQLENKIN
ncbi:hypothetical protein ACFS5N_18670 [Mucilaginibacter ximonensis]|uniref:Tetratricopeptide repeat protein n=1 Tax=Mucilaginibacter ximonensis TaxID=538021 RepID=A0ABW5YGL4_9SPHI